MKNILIIFMVSIALHTYANPVDTAYFNHTIAHITQLMNVNPDSAMLELDRMENECKNLNYDLGLAQCYNKRGGLLKAIGDFPEALKYFSMALDVYEKLEDEKGIAESHLFIGSVYVHLSAYDQSMDHIHKALDYYEENQDHFALGGAYMNMSGLYIYLKEYELGKEYIEKAIARFKIIDYQLGICGCMLNKAIILYDQQKYEKCLVEFEQVVQLADEINSNYYKADSWTYMGSAHIQLGNLDQAEQYLEKILSLKDVNSQLLIEAYFYLGDLFLAKGNYHEAITYAQKVINESKKLNLLGNEQMAYDRLALYYSKQGKYKEALKAKELSYHYRDSIFNTEKTKEIQRLEAIYQVEKREQKIENLENENQIQQLKIQKAQYTYVGIILLLTIVLGGTILFIRNSRLKVINENILLEQRLLRSQMNPHFIFNAISAIQHYVMKNKALEASSYLSSFAKLMRSILQNSRKELVSLETEFQTLEDYLNLQRLRLDGKLDFKIIGKDSLDSQDIYIPPMLIQPFIENAIEHGILKKDDQKGSVNIFFREEKNNLFVEIVDDGVGRKKADEEKAKKHQSFATEITRSRIKSMKQSYKKKISFDIIDLKSDTNDPIGTKVIFTLPLMSA